MTIDWAEAREALSRERESYGADPGRFPILLGVTDPEAMTDAIVADVVDTVNSEVPSMIAAFRAQGWPEDHARYSAFASAMATHSQMYLELGLWLAQTGRVKP